MRSYELTAGYYEIDTTGNDYINYPNYTLKQYSVNTETN